jgi:hypothetical protein
MIEHVVISSGGPHGFVQLGMLLEAVHAGILDIQNIKTVHGCSSGSIMGTLLCLKIPVQDIIDYFITRKWEKCIQYDIHQFTEKKGIVDTQFIAEIVIPFFKAYDVPLTITMEEFYQRTKVDFDIITTEAMEMKSVTLNHSTFPDLPVLTAIQMSSAIPVMFYPILYNNTYYIDGVCRKHCPFVDYPEDTVCIFMIDSSCNTTLNLEDVSEYFQHLLLTSYRILTASEDIPKGRRFLCSKIPSVMSADLWKNIIQNESYRREMIEVGRSVVRDTLSEPVE